MNLYRTLRRIVRIYFQLFFRFRVKGEENIPSSGPVILIANHISNYDPPVLACAIQRQVHFMAKEELFSIPILGALLLKIGAFPVKRGGNDRKAIKQAFQVLNENRVLGIFPEGTRSKTGKLGKGMPGAALFAIKSDAKVIPVGIQSRYKWFQPINVNIGSPISLDSYKQEKVRTEDLEEIVDFLMMQIQKQLNEIKG
ncbi:lysophospholipid acyltransferase family protein [Tepidibacillus fermentans]|uniref:1-acyl-sn-glycerol-3-phosphate acyltransferase n=1 Tax=Tepidibacillus fermentans TaxID=1281767 RepID=A0A4R3KK86_9BACI|nr:lysophospholipid acyltransferase family protein [Tepidibacillus fermentans]TCS84124.1 1-acyl-sn-glycerol-3-phosphate acyltransferase [Tepidibacillus fermentans]